MQIKYLQVLSFLLSIPLFAQAEQPVSQSDQLASQTQEPQFIQYDNRVVMFIPFHQCYERIKTEAFYVGAEAFLVGSKKNHILLNSELRAGYNFFLNQKDHLTPFAGAGYIEDFYFHDNIHLRHKPGIAYGTLGFLYTHEFTSVFNLGINGKVMIGGPVSKNHFNWGSPVIGTQFSVPITFRFGRDRHWDFRLEPFNLYLRGSRASRDYSGCLVTLGYRF